MSDGAGPTQAVDEFFVKQRLTLMVNRYEIRTVAADGSDGTLLAFAEQKRMAMREQVTFFADDAKTQPVFGFKSRKIVDVGGTTDVFDDAGRPIGAFTKDFRASLLRSTWHLDVPGRPTATGQERSIAVALLRRFVDEASWLPFHFDFSGPQGPVMSVQKKFAWGRDRYHVSIFDPQLDRRVAMAMAVALDALQGR